MKIVSLLFTVLAALLYVYSFDRAEQKSLATGHIPMSNKANNHVHLNHVSKKTIRPLPKNEIEKEPTDALLIKSKQYFAQTMDVEHSHLAHNILEDLSKDFEELHKASTLLQNPRDTKRKYDKEQAQIRVFAVELLEQAAKFGELEILEQTITKMLEDYQKNNSIPGYHEDVVDLLSAWIKYCDKELLLSDPSYLFDTFHYNNNMWPLFATALRYALTIKEILPIYPQLSTLLRG